MIDSKFAYLLVSACIQQPMSSIGLLYIGLSPKASHKRFYIVFGLFSILALVLPLYCGDFDALVVALFLGCCLLSMSVKYFAPHFEGFAVPLLAFRLFPSFVAGYGFIISFRSLYDSRLLYIASALFCVLASVSVLRTFLFGGMSGLVFSSPRRDAALRLVSAPARDKRPKVSVHLPCYSEPPELVSATLCALAALDYDDFEVIVVDNNTPDPAIWLPVQNVCSELGDRFRFFHVDKMAGAKAGALNFALRHTSADADLIAIVDADYLAEPDFLRFAALFEDEKVGFVQTSHDYRGWQGSRFLRGAYYEYIPFHKVSLPVINEFSASFTVGTMCILRKTALEQVGGWSEDCLTEDSEVAIRIHALGYVGHTFAATAGRGFIPETIGSMKRQQFRWTAGPVQQFLMHWRLLFGLSENGSLSVNQRVMELHHSTARLGGSIQVILDMVLMTLLIGSILLSGPIAVPSWAAALIGVGFISTLIDNAVVVRLSGGSGWKDQFYSTLIRNGLDWTHTCASLAPLLGRRLAWKRTSKYKKQSNLSRILSDTWVEASIGTVHLVLAAVLLISNVVAITSLSTLLALLLVIRGSSFLCAPLIGLLAELDLRLSGSEIAPAL